MNNSLKMKQDDWLYTWPVLLRNYFQYINMQIAARSGRISVALLWNFIANFFIEVPSAFLVGKFLWNEGWIHCTMQRFEEEKIYLVCFSDTISSTTVNYGEQNVPYICPYSCAAIFCPCCSPVVQRQVK